jgi:hypothetical protein
MSVGLGGPLASFRVGTLAETLDPRRLVPIDEAGSHIGMARE